MMTQRQGDDVVARLDLDNPLCCCGDVYDEHAADGPCEVDGCPCVAFDRDSDDPDETT